MGQKKILLWVSFSFSFSCSIVRPSVLPFISGTQQYFVGFPSLPVLPYKVPEMTERKEEGAETINGEEGAQEPSSWPLIDSFISGKYRN